MNTKVIPSIYVACLAAYNAGILHGVTIDFYDGIDESDVEQLIEEMIATSPAEFAEEWQIHDSEYFADVKTNNLEALVKIAELIREHGEEAMKGFVSQHGSSVIEELDNFSDVYLGCYSSEAAFCQEQFEIAESAEKIRVFDWATLDQYIDWEAIANDAFINVYYSHQPHYDKVYVYQRT